ncbi:MAG: DUF192 domain-containing protein [Candidatus Peribacteraceae bacterium]|nr:DUF192 domain-containing protein [Candidatus Peribacteraceae bacterium]MDD5742021.1 DUF192 domain-containing protein [Candidatus Peribacteraceae bacterium]
MTAGRILTGFLCLAMISGCGPAAVAVPQKGVVPIQLSAPDGRTVTVLAELARTPAQQQRGLMGRQGLGVNAGMFFIFPQQQALSFWMKNTLIPLDIVFFDDTGNTVSWATMLPCPAESAVCPTTLSAGPARFALEVPAGFVQQTGLTSDWRLVIGPWVQDS